MLLLENFQEERDNIPTLRDSAPVRRHEARNSLERSLQIHA